MNKFDVIVISILSISAVFGFIRGITKEILSIISWTGAIVVAYLGLPFTQYVAREYISNPMLADAATAFCLFLIFLIVFSLCTHFLSDLVKHSALSSVDRSLGFGFGIVRAIAIIFLAEMVVSIFIARPEHPDIFKHSRFANFIYKGSDTTFNILPSKIKGWINGQKIKKHQDNLHSVVEEQILKQALPNLSKQNLNQQSLQSESERISSVNKQNSPKKTIVTNSQDIAAPKIQSVEELSNLKPKNSLAKEVPEEGKNIRYTKKQQIEMDRLLNQEDED